MEIRKFEAYKNEGGFKSYPEQVDYLVAEIEDKIKDPLILEPIKFLAEFCYKEGYKDGYRFADWLHEKTK